MGYHGPLKRGPDGFRDYNPLPSNRQAIVPGPLQNQPTRFGEDEHPPREPRAMKRAQEARDDYGGSKRMKIEEAIEKDTTAYDRARGGAESHEHHRGPEERNRDRDGYRQEGSSAPRQGELRIKGESRQERIPPSVINVDDEDELNCLSPAQSQVPPRSQAPPTAKPKGGIVSTVLGFLTGSSDSSVPSETLLPSPSQCLSDAERQDLLEQAALSCAELEYTTRLLYESRERGDALQRQLSKALTGEEMARKEMQKALSELESSRVVTQRLESSRGVSQEEHTRLMTQLMRAGEHMAELETRIQSLAQEKEEAITEARGLRKAMAKAPTPDKISLDVFDNTLDQVSEAHVKCTGRTSLDGLNDSLHNLVDTVLEDAAKIAMAYIGDRTPVDARSYHDSDHLHKTMLAALAVAGLKEEHRGLLLDASLHHIVVGQLHSLFFRGEVFAFANKETLHFEELFNVISDNESWSTSQRCRAILASNLSKMCPPSVWEDYARRSAGEIIGLVTWAYGVSLEPFDSIRQTIAKELTSIFRDAHELSVILKRDILSVRMSVMLASGHEGGFNPHDADSVWPEMGVKPGDDVLGDYSFGLVKRMKTGESILSTLPKVFTAALIREVEKK